MIAIPADLDVLLFGADKNLGSNFSDLLRSEKIPHFAPPPGLVDLSATQYLKMLLEGLTPKCVVNCIYSEDAGDPNAPNINSLIPFCLSQVCGELKIPWFHFAKSFEDPILKKTVEDGLKAIDNSDASCTIFKVKTQEDIEEAYKKVILQIK